MNILEILQANMIAVDLKSSDKTGVLTELSRLFVTVCPKKTVSQITAKLLERERLATTGIGGGIAIPHNGIDHISNVHAALGISKAGIAFDAADGKPVYIFVALVAPQDAVGDQLKALACVSRVFKDPAFLNTLRKVRTGKEAYEAIVEKYEQQ